MAQWFLQQPFILPLPPAYVMHNHALYQTLMPSFVCSGSNIDKPSLPINLRSKYRHRVTVCELHLLPLQISKVYRIGQMDNSVSTDHYAQGAIWSKEDGASMSQVTMCSRARPDRYNRAHPFIRAKPIGHFLLKICRRQLSHFQPISHEQHLSMSPTTRN